MSTALALYERLTSLGITLQYDDGQLRVRAAKGALDEALKAQLQQHKSALLQLLSGEGKTFRPAMARPGYGCGSSSTVEMLIIWRWGLN